MSDGAAEGAALCGAEGVTAAAFGASSFRLILRFISLLKAPPKFSAQATRPPVDTMTRLSSGSSPVSALR